MYLFSISVGTAVILKRNENSLCKIWWGVEGGGGGQIRCIMGNVEVAYGENITVEWFFHTNRCKF